MVVQWVASKATLRADQLAPWRVLTKVGLKVSWTAEKWAASMESLLADH